MLVGSGESQRAQRAAHVPSTEALATPMVRKAEPPLIPLRLWVQKLGRVIVFLKKEFIPGKGICLGTQQINPDRSSDLEKTEKVSLGVTRRARRNRREKNTR